MTQVTTKPCIDCHKYKLFTLHAQRVSWDTVLLCHQDVILLLKLLEACSGLVQAVSKLRVIHNLSSCEEVEAWRKRYSAISTGGTHSAHFKAQARLNFLLIH